MDKLTKDILGLPTKIAIALEDSFYFEIQRAGGGIGSSLNVEWKVLAAAINSLLFPLEHSSLSDLGADDHPQYLNIERGDARYIPLTFLDQENPFPVYQTEAEVDTQIDNKIAALKAETDPFTQYATEAQLSAEVEAAVAPIAEQKVAEYISTDAQPIIEAQVQQQVEAQLPALVNTPVLAVSSVAGVLTLDAGLTNDFVVQLTESITDIQVTNLIAGVATEIDVDFVQDAAGGHTVALPASFKALGGSDSEVAIAPAAVTVLVAKSKDDGATWRYAMQESA